MSMLLAPHGGKYGVGGFGPFFAARVSLKPTRAIGILAGGEAEFFMERLAGS
jgi:hypothetical protein